MGAPRNVSIVPAAAACSINRTVSTATAVVRSASNSAAASSTGRRRSYHAATVPRANPSRSSSSYSRNPIANRAQRTLATSTLFMVSSAIMSG